MTVLDRKQDCCLSVLITMADREEKVYFARLAEQAERYNGKLKYVIYGNQKSYLREYFPNHAENSQKRYGKKLTKFLIIRNCLL